MKKGIASREKEFTPLTVRCTIESNGISKYIAVKTEETNNVKVIGNFSKSKRTKDPMRIVVAVVGSCMVSSFVFAMYPLKVT
jgi:hypothetical protein